MGVDFRMDSMPVPQEFLEEVLSTSIANIVFHYSNEDGNMAIDGSFDLNMPFLGEWAIEFSFLKKGDGKLMQTFYLSPLIKTTENSVF